MREWNHNGEGELVQKYTVHMYGTITMRSPHIINVRSFENKNFKELPSNFNILSPRRTCRIRCLAESLQGHLLSPALLFPACVLSTGLTWNLAHDKWRFYDGFLSSSLLSCTFSRKPFQYLPSFCWFQLVPLKI
jgi:hypothetical protein